MLKLTETYTVHTTMFGVGHFRVISDKPKTNELYTFWEEIRELLNKPRFEPEGVEFNIKDKEKVMNLLYRFNMSLMGKDRQLAKREYLTQFGPEAVRAVIYATDFIPDGLDIDEYTGAVLQAFEEYGDTNDFDERLVNVAGLPTNQLSLIINQIQLFKNLLMIPYEDLEDVNGETNHQPVGELSTE